jgi:protein-disulfide isomerase
VFRNFTISDAHPHAMSAAQAAEAAGAQGRFWEMHDGLYASADGLEPAATRRLAKGLGLDLDRFDREVAGEEHVDHIFEDFNSGVSSGVNGAPTFFINGARLDWDFDAATLGAAVERAARASQGPTPNEATP